jgi:hypothetical protein
MLKPQFFKIKGKVSVGKIGVGFTEKLVSL